LGAADYLESDQVKRKNTYQC